VAYRSRFQPCKVKSQVQNESKQNTGKPTEAEFELIWNSFGKRAYVHRHQDQSDLYGLNRRGLITFPQPSDYLVVFDGAVFFAEVKSTQNAKGFAISAIKQSQRGMAKQISTAGGVYFFFIKSLLSGVWYRVPATFMLEQIGRVAWSMLDPYRWSPPK